MPQVQIAAHVGEWERVKLCGDAAVSACEIVLGDKDTDAAVEALYFSALCLQIQASWELHHKVSSPDTNLHHPEHYIYLHDIQC